MDFKVIGYYITKKILPAHVGIKKYYPAFHDRDLIVFLTFCVDRQNI